MAQPVNKKWYPTVDASRTVDPKVLNSHLRWLTDNIVDAQTGFSSLMAKITTGSAPTGTIAASSSATITVNLAQSMPNANYIVNSTVEGTSLQVVNVLRFQKQVQVTVQNTDAGAGHAGTVMVWAYNQQNH